MSHCLNERLGREREGKEEGRDIKKRKKEKEGEEQMERRRKGENERWKDKKI